MKKARVIACVLVLLLTFGLIGTASATNGSTMAELFYRDIKITLNGRAVETKDANGASVEPFIINGTTYLPVRAVSEALGLNVKWDSATSTVALSEPVELPPEGEFYEPTVLSQIEVKDYICLGDWSSYGLLTIKNNSEYDLCITASAKFYNEAGEVIGAETRSEDAFERGTETIIFFMRDEAFASMEYELTASERDSYSECVVSDLSYECVNAKNKAIVSVTNNGDIAAEYVEGHAVFFNGDKVVGFDYGYFVDADDEIKPGKTISKELYCSREFDAVKVFFTGIGYE